MPTPQQIHFTLPSGREQLAATCILPPEGKIRACLFFFPAFFEERKGALPPFLFAAREWSLLGVASLFVDPAGCGDSSGEAERLPTEQRNLDLTSAVTWLKDHFPDVPMGFVALRASSLFLTDTTLRAAFSFGVYWSPIDGKTFLRQLFQRRMVNDMIAYGKARESRKELEERLQQDSSIDLDGYPLPPSLFHWLQETPVIAPEIPLFVFTGGAALPKPFSQNEGVTLCENRFPPFWNTIGHVDLTESIQACGTWLERILTNKTAVSDSFPLPKTNTPFPEWETRHGKIRAVLQTPASPIRGILFLPGWSGDRTGPHRMFSRFAHLLTKENCATLRLDYFGRGWSDGMSQEASIARMVENAETAYQAFIERLPAGTPITLIAICSGCKVAITLASRHPELERLILWSAESMGSLRNAKTGSRKTFYTLKKYLRKLFQLSTWKKLITGKVNTKCVANALMNQETRSAQEAMEEDRILKQFRSFQKPVTFLFGGSDPDAPGSKEAYETFCQANHIPYTSHLIPHAGHSYYGEEWTQELFEISLHALRSHSHGGR